MTTETVIEKVRKELGPLDARAEQAVLATFRVMQDAAFVDVPVFSRDDVFVGENITLEEYIALSRDEQCRYLDGAEPPNQVWIERQLARLQASWIMVVDGRVVLHGATMKEYPEYEDFIALCKKTGKYPFVFFAPHVHAIEESASAWHRTTKAYDSYPTLPLVVTSNNMSFGIVADFDSGAINCFCSLDFLIELGFVDLLPGEFVRTGQHLSRPYRYFTRHAWLGLTSKNGESEQSRTPIFCVHNWNHSPFTFMNSSRTFLLGREVLFDLRPRLTLDFAARCTEVRFAAAAN